MISLQQLQKIIIITIIWSAISVFNFFLAIGAVMDANIIWNAEFDLTKINFQHGIAISLITGVLAGLLGGSMVVLVWEKWLRSKPYGTALLLMLFSYILIFIAVAVPTILFNNTYNLELTIFNAAAWNEVLIAFQSPSLFAPFFFWLFVVLLTLIALQVDDKYGPGVFRKFLMGKYFHPTREERVFMFLDLRNSTGIAEELEEEKYFNFLKEVFKIVTPAILKFNGEIYQYVGDEMVVSWKKEDGIRKNACINSFFEVQNMLKSHKKYFLEHYGIEPQFKAGLHAGHVMAGEIGVVKREIAYSGDVLNTASRIQSQCNTYGVNILISDFLFDLLHKPIRAEKIGQISLRGKSTATQLFTISS